MIGNPESMEDPTGHAMAKVTGAVTATMLIQEALHRRGAQRAEGEAAAARLRAEAVKVPDQRNRTMPAPDRDTVLRQWEQANTKGRAGEMREAERILGHTEPRLMTRYTELTRDGAKPGQAMAQATREVAPNPNPPAEVPAATGWPTGTGDPNTAAAGGGGWQAVSQLLSRGKRKGAAA